MKTPREMILERHTAAEAKLDAIRQRILDKELTSPRQGAERTCAAGWAAVLWQELVRPCKGAWAGMGVAWILVATLQALSQSPMSKSAPSSGKWRPDDRAQLREQWQLRTEMLGITGHGMANAAPGPGPQSDNRRGWDSALRRIEEETA